MNDIETLEQPLRQVTEAAIAKAQAKPAPDPDEREQARRADAWNCLASKIGKRHAGCRLHNFDAETDRQRQALHAAELFRDEIDERIERGSNLLLFGPVGTGKDHLLIGLLGAAVVNAGASAEWISGLEFWGDLRDMMGTDARERTRVSELSAPDVLAISDPSSEGDPLINWQRAFLQRVIDRRYRLMKPTWLTVNVSDRREMETTLGVPTVDRLAEDCLSIHCDWKSYRRRDHLSPRGEA